MFKRTIAIMLFMAAISTATAITAGSGSGRGCCSKTECSHEHDNTESCSNGTCLKEYCRTCNGPQD